MKGLKLCLACSAGGHLTEMMHLERCYAKHDHFFLTFRRQDTSDLGKSEHVRFVTDPGRNPLKLLRCMRETFAALSAERPDVVISTGAGVALPACYMAKLLFGSKVVFLESFCRVEEPSFAGRLAYPIADKFLVQWPKLAAKYGRKAEYKGAIV
ncbi:MAG: capsular biosynthesis protein [Candidatus Aenigmarchaeota archaeon]|nr:capsular biosynthesis protein [Candidatus Aenigmarchaeota archaeon]